MGRINLLDPLLSSRIAAGEVIERPQSVLREFLDNSLDAGASEINVSIDGGGIERLSVQDDGNGISREDLSLIATRHATSKIHKPDDLYEINTLGFRGEALYSISSVSTLTISTRDKESGEESTLVIDNGKRYPVSPQGPYKGTVCTSENLFGEIPARRNFLKRASTETNLCRALLSSKALAFPFVRFTLRVDGDLRLQWPQAKDHKERVMMLWREYGVFDSDIVTLEKKEEDYSITVVAGNSSVKRSDKKEIRIYVNSRPVEEYSMVQAVLYGYGELLPGGSFPYCAVFITDKAELVDFNIHPAKKEVKIRNKADIHHTLSSMIKSGIERKIPEIKSVRQFYLDDAERWENGRKRQSYGKDNREEEKKENKQPPLSSYSFKREEKSEELQDRTSSYRPSDSKWLEKAKELKAQREKAREESAIRESKAKEEKNEEREDFRYIGQAFNLFLIAEKGNDLYLVDQHAAHERILYDELLELKTVQKLLIPIKIEVDDLTDDYLERNAHVYTKLGISLLKTGKGEWEVDALPAMCKGQEKEITSFITEAKSSEHELEERLFATMSCRAAIKQGDAVDKWAAQSILSKVFQMEEPCCPHGRTFLVKISNDTLKEMVGRTK